MMGDKVTAQQDTGSSKCQREKHTMWAVGDAVVWI